MANAALLALALCISLFAGCTGNTVTTPVGPATPSPNEQASTLQPSSSQVQDGHASPAPLQTASAQPTPANDFRVELRDCIEGGGHTKYSAGNPVTDPFTGSPRFAPPEWQPADIREDTDNPLFGPGFIPLAGPAYGYYHATVKCKSWTYDGVTYDDWTSGHVGIRIEPPSFDVGKADREYLIGTLPFGSPAIAAALRAAGVPATTGNGTIEQTPSWHSELKDDLNGTYISWNEMKDLGAVDDHTVRLWFVVQVSENKWRPVALDMTTEGGPHHLAANGGGKFSHQHIGEPPPSESRLPLGLSTSDTAGLGWSGFHRVITLGPQPDVLLDHAFIHH